MGKNDFTERRASGHYSMREVPIPPREEREKAAALERQKAKGVEANIYDDIAGDNGAQETAQEKPPPKFAQDLKKDFSQSDPDGDKRMTAFAEATIKGRELLAIQIPPRQVIIPDWYWEADLGFV
jgi:hypothetical protein